MKKLLFKINAERVLLFALVYYGLSIYFDIFFYVHLNEVTHRAPALRVMTRRALALDS